MNLLTGLFGAGTALRNALFDRKILRSHRLDKPVISVGNLSVGGSGKTPFVIALGELLAQRGIRCDVLSRGYRRKTRGVLAVDVGGTPADYGDEPLLIARSLKIPVIVGESRYEAGRFAEGQFAPQVHILDDGFQHRSLHRDFEIVLLSADDLKDELLPSGRLREPLSSLKRADVIVLPKETQVDHPAFYSKPIWRMHRELALPAVSPTPIAFCGIARPQQFFALLRASGVSPVAELAFRDHHAYGPADINRLRTMQHERGAGGFVTTEKDAINLGPLSTELRPLSVAVLRIALEHSANAIDTILARIAKQNPLS